MLQLASFSLLLLLAGLASSTANLPADIIVDEGSALILECTSTQDFSKCVWIKKDGDKRKEIVVAVRTTLLTRAITSKSLSGKRRPRPA